MPIVFVHGVNNRQGEAYRETEVSRNGFLKEIVAPALGLSPHEVYISNPYWGGDGARFEWGMAVLPDPDVDLEQFGSSANLESFARLGTVIENSPLAQGGSILDAAKRDFPALVDVIFASAMAGATTESEAQRIARAYLRASDYAEQNLSPVWLSQSAESNFMDQLMFQVDANGSHSTDREETFGAGGILDSLKEGFSRLINTIPAVGSSVATRLSRKQLNATVTRFTGDAFTYLTGRGTKDAPGPIVRVVLNALHEAMKKKTNKDNKIVVIAHSFGGEILYDILTHFDATLQIDCLLTVGSQVGLFEEMKLYVESKLTIPPDPPKGKIQRPAGLKRWLNVFDLNDILSFRVEPVFEGTSDFYFDTGYSSLSAHGGYFMRPSFYKRLARRLQE